MKNASHFVLFFDALMTRKHTTASIIFQNNALLAITRYGSILSVFVSWRDVALERARNKLAMQEFKKVLAANLVSTFVAARAASWRKLSYWVTGLLTDLICLWPWLSDWLANWLAYNCLMLWLIVWLTRLLTVCLSDGLIIWLADWLTDRWP